MNTKLLSQKALSIIEQYNNFVFYNAFCSVPYFNNKTKLIRAGLRVNIGKGSPKDIYDELRAFAIKNHIDPNSIDNDSLKKILVDNNIGIDCSAYAYYILNAFSIESSFGQLDKHLKFTYCKGLVGKLRCKLRPLENCDVITMSNDKNSHEIRLDEVNVGDFISFVNSSDDSVRDHIAIVYKVEYQNFKSVKFYITHAAAYPEDGLYGTGTKNSEITITSPDLAISEQIWSDPALKNRSEISTTTIRRFNWFK